MVREACIRTGRNAALVQWGDGERGWDVGHSWHSTGHPGADRDALNLERSNAALMRSSKVGRRSSVCAMTALRLATTGHFYASPSLTVTGLRLVVASR